METYFENLARLKGSDALLVCDRGTCDTFAYCSKEVKQAVLDREGWTMDFLKHDRYDKVIHMVTAANGAETHFDYGNQARSETLEEAVELDRRTQAVWFDSPSYKIIDNSDADFSRKIGRVLNQVGDLVSFPVEKFVRKFLLQKVFSEDYFPAEVEYSVYTETVIYLPSQRSKSKTFVTRREFEHSGKVLHSLKTRKLSTQVEKRIETSCHISQKVFEQFYLQRNCSKNVVTKRCYTFKMEENAQVFLYKIETFLGASRRFSVLHSTSSSERRQRPFPRFVKVEREVTEDPDFFSHRLAKDGFFRD